MNIENATPKEIQQYIYDEIAQHKNPQAIKDELTQKGILVEGYYFMPQAEQKIQAETLPASPGVSGWQVIVTIFVVIVMIFRIIRCTNKM